MPRNALIRFRDTAFAVTGAVFAFAAALVAVEAEAQSPVTTCDADGIGAVGLEADGPVPSIEAVSTEAAGGVPYCLVKVRVPEAIRIWVGLPLDGEWNGRWQSVGGGVYSGTVSPPAAAVGAGYAAATTDTGHEGGRADMPVPPLDGSFAMREPGVPDRAKQIDFAYRSEHLMAVIGTQLVRAFYGEPPAYRYWNGCSTGGRQGLRMAQDFPDAYDGVLAGAPAIHWDRFQAAHLWPQMTQRLENGGPIGGGDADVLGRKMQLATDAAVAACDARDGVTDGVLTDPRRCDYTAADDASITSASCAASDGTCLTPGEATAIDRIWQGPVDCHDDDGACAVPDTASRALDTDADERLWYGMTRGTDLTSLGGVMPFRVSLEQPKYWVYLEPDWDWRTLDYASYPAFFADTVNRVGPLMASDNPDLAPFRDSGGKLLLWHGWIDPLIMPEGTLDYYERVTRALGGDYARTQAFARLFMAPGVAHCGGGNGPQPQDLFETLVDWVEDDAAPERIRASRSIDDGTRTRPLCPYPAEASWTGEGSTDDAASFACEVPSRGP